MFPGNPLLRRDGLGSGRISAAGHASPVGGTTYVLGSDSAGVVERVSVGDYTQISAVGDLVTGDPAYATVTFWGRAPAEMPAGVVWRVSFWVVDPPGGTTPARATFDLGAGHDNPALRQLSAPLRGVLAAGSQQLRVRLELAGTAGDYDVELPGIYVEGVVLPTTAARATVINLLPEDGEEAVPVTSTIAFEINDPDASTVFGGNIRATDTQVYVDDVLAYDGAGSGFQTGFDGPDSSADFSTLDGGRTARLVIDPTDLLASSAVVRVRLVTTAYGGDASEHLWAFSTEDLTAPTVVEAVSTGRRSVRVHISEALDAAALEAANWTISVASISLEDGLPAVTPVVASVVRVDPTTFDLALDIDVTRGALYLVELSGVADLVGNPMVAPGNAAYFRGYACETPPGREWELIYQLPGMNLAEDETGDLRRFVGCLQEVVDVVLCDVDHWTEILDPDVAPERFVDAMLADLGNPFPFALSESDKRRLVRILVPIYELKGTDQGIIDAVRFFVGREVTIEVPAYDGVWELGISELGVGTFLGTSNLTDKLTFYIRSGITLTDEERERIRAIAVYMKNAPTHLGGILEPTPPPAEPSHWELGLSELGVNTLLH